MSELKTQFGKRLSILRKTRGFTQEELAEKVGLSVEFISLIERGINFPSFSTLEKLSLALEIPFSEFFQFDEK